MEKSEEEDNYLDEKDNWPNPYGNEPISEHEFYRQEKALGHLGDGYLTYEQYLEMYNNLVEKKVVKGARPV